MKAHQLLAIAMSAVAGSACGDDIIKWTEEVRLHDGKTIRLERKTEVTASGFPTQSRGFHKYHQFCYSPMGIHWKSQGKYAPEVFDIVNGRAYAKVSTVDCEVCKLHGNPQTDALYFVWSGKAWNKLDAQEFPPQLRLNLLMNAKGRAAADDPRGIVSLSEKERRDPSIHVLLEKSGARGLNELPASRGMCTKCKDVNVMSKGSPDVFLPSRETDCK